VAPVQVAVTLLAAAGVQAAQAASPASSTIARAAARERAAATAARFRLRPHSVNNLIGSSRTPDTFNVTTNTTTAGISNNRHNVQQDFSSGAI
jgi:hypothetical protein